jgi:hypothetical protein
MMDDVLEEVRRAREAYAERFNFDLAAIFRDLRERELVGGREVVSLPPKRIVPVVDVPVIDDTNPDSGSGLASAPVKSP